MRWAAKSASTRSPPPRASWALARSSTCRCPRNVMAPFPIRRGRCAVTNRNGPRPIRSTHRSARAMCWSARSSSRSPPRDWRPAANCCPRSSSASRARPRASPFPKNIWRSCAAEWTRWSTGAAPPSPRACRSKTSAWAARPAPHRCGGSWIATAARAATGNIATMACSSASRRSTIRAMPPRS